MSRTSPGGIGRKPRLEIPGAARRRAIRREGPEDSILIRVVVLATVMVAVVATVAQGAMDDRTALAAFVLIPLGYWYSYTSRRRRNIPLKVALAFAMLAALGSFITTVQVAPSVDAARGALASLFVWVQIIHSFDLPRRRDLAFSIGSSLALMAEAGSLSLSSSFVFFVVPYAILGGMWLFLSSRARNAELVTPGTSIRARTPGNRDRESLRLGGRRIASRPVAAALSVTLLAGATLFLAIPRVQGTQVVAPPFSLTSRVAVPGFSGAIVNPGVTTQSASGTESTQFTANAYPGFGTNIDLRARGHLSDDIVMKVRTTQPAFWRAQVYDHFDGTTWTSSNPETQSIAVTAPTIISPGDGWVSGAPAHEVVQTFYVQQEQPNVVFAAYAPTQLYFPAATVSEDAYASVRSPILLEEGMIYSVVSEVPDATPQLLRQSGDKWDPAFLAQYTQLPAGTPARDIALAHRITDGLPTTYDKVMAVQNWLKTHTEYNLDIAPDPADVNAVDYFLFERRQGFCEHFASAMIVLLRAAGIPARFAVGYGAGQRNPFTGYYEVRQSDAHSWVEVDYPNVGWMEYDPTHVVPDAGAGIGSTFIAPQVFRAIGRFLAAALPEPVKAFLAAVGRALASAARAGVRVWPVPIVLLIVAGIAVVATRRRSLRRRLGPPPAGASAAFLALCRVFAARGHARSPARTPSEHVADLLAHDPLARDARTDLERIVGAFEWEQFGARPPSENDVRDALSAAARLEDIAGRASRRSRMADSSPSP